MLFAFTDCFLCVFNADVTLLDTGRHFEVITSRSADVYKQEEVLLFLILLTLFHPC